MLWHGDNMSQGDSSISPGSIGRRIFLGFVALPLLLLIGFSVFGAPGETEAERKRAESQPAVCDQKGSGSRVVKARYLGYQAESGLLGAEQLDNGQALLIRLCGVQLPAAKSADGEEACGAQEAQRAIEKAFGGSDRLSVRIQDHVVPPSRPVDIHATVDAGDTSLGVTLLREGAGLLDPDAQPGSPRLHRSYRAAAHEAKRASRGLYGYCGL